VDIFEKVGSNGGAGFCFDGELGYGEIEKAIDLMADTVSPEVQVSALARVATLIEQLGHYERLKKRPPQRVKRRVRRALHGKESAGESAVEWVKPRSSCFKAEPAPEHHPRSIRRCLSIDRDEPAVHPFIRMLQHVRQSLT
jgi:hypothetical protein